MSSIPPAPRLAESPPPRPGRWQERLSTRLFRGLAPRLSRRDLMGPPSALEPFELFSAARPEGLDPLSATWFPASGPARGAVLLAAPWNPWGQAYFYRYGRLEALRAAGYHALTFDLGGFAGRSAYPRGFYDRDLAVALGALRDRAGDLPLHVWGVSAGGYWLHPLLSGASGIDAPPIAGAFFEDVARHLIEWSKRMTPMGRPAFYFFQNAFRGAYRYMDLRLHAPFLRVGASAYVGGGRDRGVPAEETRELARLAGGACRIVEQADHLHAIKRDGEAVIALALETFERGAARTQEFGAKEA